MEQPKINVFKLAFSTIIGLLGVIATPTTPFGRSVIWFSNDLAPNNRWTMDEAINLYLQDDMPEADFLKVAKAYGYNEYFIKQVIRSRRKFLDIRDYITLFRRGELPREIFTAYMRTFNYPEEEIELLLKSQEYFPAAPDLIRFAVREVYSPDVRQRFGMDEDLPKQFIDESAKVGLPENQAKNFWAAHWALPSPGQGYEMLHRGIINEDDLKLLLRALDIMPYWRDKLIKMSYNVLTRVDVRRMYRIGELKEEDVYDAYLKYGYSPENAEKMTNFTVIYENQENTGLTRGNIVKAYKEDLITKDKLESFLYDIGYSEKVTNFWLNMAEYEKTLDYVEKVKKDVIELFQMGAITEDDVRDRLLALNVPTQFIERVLKDVIIEESKRRKIPSKSDLTGWLDKGIIDELYYMQKMRLLGYKDTDIQFYLSEVAIDKDTTKRRFLKETQYVEWYKKKMMSEKDLYITLHQMGLKDVDISNLILGAKE